MKILRDSTRFNLEHQKTFRDSDYLLRKPCFLHKSQYALEEHIINLRKYKSIDASIICSGLLYGLDFPEKWLH